MFRLWIRGILPKYDAKILFFDNVLQVFFCLQCYFFKIFSFDALSKNQMLELQRNKERFQFLKVFFNFFNSLFLSILYCTNKIIAAFFVAAASRFVLQLH